MDYIIQALRSRDKCILGKGTHCGIIQQSEEELQIKFASDYYQYLLNVGLATYDGHELTGICKASRLNVVDVTKAEKRKHKSIPDDFYVIEQANIDGIVIWQNSTGEIFQTVFDGVPKLICKSLCDYIERYGI